MDTHGAFRPQPSTKLELLDQMQREISQLREAVQSIAPYCPNDCAERDINNALVTLLEKALRLETMVRAEHPTSERRMTISYKQDTALCTIDYLPCGQEVLYCRVLGTTTTYTAHNLDKAKEILKISVD